MLSPIKNFHLSKYLTKKKIGFNNVCKGKNLIISRGIRVHDLQIRRETSDLLYYALRLKFGERNYL